MKQNRGEHSIMKLKKALEIINWYSQMILIDKAQTLDNMDGTEIEYLEESVERIREFLEDIK